MEKRMAAPNVNGNKNVIISTASFTGMALAITSTWISIPSSASIDLFFTIIDSAFSRLLTSKTISASVYSDIWKSIPI